jgi:hypothetical protein
VRSEELKTAKIESSFRDVNERIAETAEVSGSDSVELVCECDDPECGTRIEAGLDDYEEAHARTEPTSSSPRDTRIPRRSACSGPGRATGSSRS